MKKILLLSIPFLLCGCTPAEQGETTNYNDYGAFLGRSDNNTENFDNYKYLSFEFDDFKKSTISDLNSKGIECFAYFNVGSLETYRDYYDQFKEFTFMDYENWDDERWIDITENSWQTYLINTMAASFKEKGASGVYMDNVDVYSVFKENDMNYSKAASAIKNIIEGVNSLGLKVLMNGGAEFIDDMNDKNDSILNSIWAYHQEEVFSLILDYHHDRFGKQNAEDSSYYKNIAKIMKNKGSEVFLLEYTKDSKLINEISDYCSTNQYHYYCSTTVDLK